MSNTIKKAIREFEIMESLNDAGNPFTVLEFKKEILALVEKFGESGQSGGSAPFTAGVITSTIKKLCMHETITPLTGNDSEWNENDWGDNTSYQNNRNSAVFKDSNSIYYLHAIVWQGEDKWDTFGGTINGISSSWDIKSFPFTPKTFYINVQRELYNPDKHGESQSDVVSCGTGDYIYFIKDPAQLDEVRAYYNQRVRRKVDA